MTIRDDILDNMVRQDAPNGDLTTDALSIGHLEGAITYQARDAMVLCGVEEAVQMLEAAGVRICFALKSTTLLEAGQVFLEAEGPAGSLHQVWKVSQTLIEYLSGIATRTRRIIDAARAVNPQIAVACTRKNFPGTKEASIRAVKAGGGIMHRLGLSETILVFPEHRAFLEEPATIWIGALKAAAPEKKIVVEVDSEEDAREIIDAGADVIQLEKFDPARTAAVVSYARQHRIPPLIAIAGGVNETNAADYAATGCGLLVTSAPYFGKPMDVKIRILRR